MKDYYIKTKDLSVGYQGKVLIRDINLDIKKGGDRYPDRTKWCGKIHHIKERYQTVETDRGRSLSRFR